MIKGILYILFLCTISILMAIVFSNFIITGDLSWIEKIFTLN